MICHISQKFIFSFYLSLMTLNEDWGGWEVGEFLQGFPC